ncbi:hypothetical protein P175DRAFT_0536280 [Aspergillus ochraceoroseus IBT 24754]|uniref:Uncharacterized protein n=1 Tax=Aspergillus ochraceoroseus IBT 24754 TaxID=1392256 RepID=A0A2T5LLB8_9EURO|nr:uncharacterized protein P175DRAFT_0536280 [Aspergillus ochraceoroseus IBT 24754]PTU17078.1 hypothetical protein P175DRAFT_0536280 [Aspergillus ochraceoroseus IBT 24754]
MPAVTACLHNPQNVTRCCCFTEANKTTTKYYYQATAEFIHHGQDGKLEKQKVPIKIGDLQNTYVMIPPDIGHALGASTRLAGPALRPAIVVLDTSNCIKQSHYLQSS